MRPESKRSNRQILTQFGLSPSRHWNDQTDILFNLMHNMILVSHWFHFYHHFNRKERTANEILNHRLNFAFGRLDPNSSLDLAVLSKEKRRRTHRYWHRKWLPRVPLNGDYADATSSVRMVNGIGMSNNNHSPSKFRNGCLARPLAARQYWPLLLQPLPSYHHQPHQFTNRPPPRRWLVAMIL